MGRVILFMLFLLFCDVLVRFVLLILVCFGGVCVSRVFFFE